MASKSEFGQRFEAVNSTKKMSCPGEPLRKELRLPSGTGETSGRLFVKGKVCVRARFSSLNDTKFIQW